ncbi:50S ribosomal protein L23 [Candidatus Nardonella dryophthoridicola]|uniref:50S ribosomal protein L23 n=1 Tax=endosymbiont of Metamasius hemipterus TaxID=204627 RepID=A0ABT0TW69_9GAMM|nr:50S ribosomal protein L23 [Candidatus Nardonella dryophthoridicola]MCM0158240.1 50S ribosomal protein L23 [endosymbiont of Metamasius hemipterus]
MYRYKEILFNIIKYPIFSNKSIILYKKYNILLLKVSNNSNKIIIKEAIKKIFNIDSIKINILNYKKHKKNKIKSVFLYKKAFIYLNNKIIYNDIFYNKDKKIFIIK